MKYLKILGLAAIAAAALMAFVGAGTAAAETTLCKETPVTGPEGTTACPEGKEYVVGQKIVSEGVETPKTEHQTPGESKTTAEKVSAPTLTGPFGSITCTAAKVEGEIETATTPSGKATTSWETAEKPCTGGTAQTVTPGKLTIHHDAEHNGTVTLEGFIVKVVQAGIPCYYSSEGVDGTLTGGNLAVLHVTAKVPKIDTATHDSNAFCPATGDWHATYKVTSPTPLYVTTK